MTSSFLDNYLKTYIKQIVCPQAGVINKEKSIFTNFTPDNPSARCLHVTQTTVINNLRNTFKNNWGAREFSHGPNARMSDRCTVVQEECHLFWEQLRIKRSRVVPSSISASSISSSSTTAFVDTYNYVTKAVIISNTSSVDFKCFS